MDDNQNYIEPFQSQLEDNGPEDSSFDSALYSVQEAKLIIQRNRHYCNPTLMRRFQRLVRVDCAELYFNTVMALENIADDVGCQNQVADFCKYVEEVVWPEYWSFHENTIKKTRRMSRSLNDRIPI